MATQYVAIQINQIDAEPILRNTLEEIFSLSNIDEKIIVSYEYMQKYPTVLNVNSFHRYKDGQKIKFIIADRFQIIDIKTDKPIDKESKCRSYCISVEDLLSKRIEKLFTPFAKTVTIINYIIRELVYASKFPTWAEYQNRKAKEDEVQQLKAENEQLKKELQACKKNAV